MIHFNKWLKSLIIVPISLLMSFDSLIAGRFSELDAGELLILKIFERAAVDDMQVFVFIIDKLVYLILFHLMYGNLISEEFRYNSIYVFYRLSNRKKWFYKKALSLFAISVCYTFFFLGTNLLICMRASKNKLHISDIQIFLILFLIITLTLMFTTLIINLLSLKLGSNISFMITYIAIVFFIFLTLYGQGLTASKEYSLFTLLNPMSGINVGVMENVSTQIIFICYYLLLNVIVTLIGARFIDNFDIALCDMENK